MQFHTWTWFCTHIIEPILELRPPMGNQNWLENATNGILGSIFGTSSMPPHQIPTAIDQERAGVNLKMAGICCFRWKWLEY